MLVFFIVYRCLFIVYIYCFAANTFVQISVLGMVHECVPYSSLLMKTIHFITNSSFQFNTAANLPGTERFLLVELQRTRSLNRIKSVKLHLNGLTNTRTNTRGVNPVFTRLQVALNPHRMTPFLLRPNKSAQLLKIK